MSFRSNRRSKRYPRHSVQRSPDTFAGRKLFLTYRSQVAPEGRIELDLNFLFRLPIDGTKVATLWQPGELDQPRLKMVSKTELCVGKLLALLDRCAPRDAWDVARFEETCPDILKSPTFRIWFTALSVTLDHPMWTYGKKRLQNRLNQRAVDEQLRPMLLGGDKTTARELRNKVWAQLKPLLTLRTEEKQYIEKVHEGELRPALLTGEDSSLADRIAKHPAIQWKLLNVQEHASRRGKSSVAQERGAHAGSQPPTE